MIMKTLILFLFLLPLISSSQTNLDEFKGLESSGKIPRIFSELNNEKTLEKNNKTLNRRKKKFGDNEYEYSLTGSFTITELFRSGKIIFGDPISQYVTKIGNSILEKNNINKTGFEFYIINSFSIRNSVIFISTGLIAKLNSEAELAYILSREIAHYQLEHKLKNFLFPEYKLLDNQNKMLFKNLLIKESPYSYDQDQQADTAGVTIFHKAKYSLKALNGAFKIFTDSNTHYSNLPFHFSFLEAPDYKLTATTSNIKTTEFSPKSEEGSIIDEPKIITREKQFFKKNSTLKNTSSKTNFFRDEDFKKIRNIARFSNTKALINEGDYNQALYNNFNLSKEFPNNFYLNYTTARALYFISKYKLRQIPLTKYPSKKAKGRLYEVYNLTETTPSIEVSLLTVKKLWELHSNYPTINSISKMMEEIMIEVIDRDLVNNSYFINQDLQNYITDRLEIINKIDIDSNYTRSSKYSNISKGLKFNDEYFEKGKDSYVVKVEEKCRFMFHTELKTTGFQLFLKNSFDKHKSKSKNSIQFGTDISEITLEKDTFISLPNSYYIFDARKSDIYRINTSIKKQIQLEEAILESAEILQLNSKCYKAHIFDIDEIQKYNNFMYLSNVISSISKSKQIDSIILSTDALSPKRYLEFNNYILTTDNFISFSTKDDAYTASAIIASIVIFPYAPYIIQDALTSDHKTSYSFTAYDLKSGKLIIEKDTKIIGRYNRALIRSAVFSNMKTSLK